MYVCASKRDPIEVRSSTHTQRRMRSGHVHFGRTATWKEGGGTQDWCERQDRFELDLRIKPARGGLCSVVAVQTSKGGKAKGARRGIPNSISVIAPGTFAGTKNETNIISALLREIIVLRPGECRSSPHSHQQRDAFFLSWGPIFHKQNQYLLVLCPLIIAFPFW